MATVEQPVAVPTAGRFRRSRGIALPVLVAAIISLSVVFLQGGFTVSSAGWGRVWPSTDSTKVALPDMAP